MNTSHNYRIPVILAVVMAYLVVSPLTAQTGVLTLDDAVRLSLEHNRSIEQASLSASGFDYAIAHAAGGGVLSDGKR